MNKSKIAVWAGVLAGVALAVACAEPTGTARQDDPATAVRSTQTPPEPGTVREGQYAVGRDVEPGRYETTVPDGEALCYWARLRSADGTMGAIIANGTGKGGAPMILQVAASDAFVQLQGGCVWRRTGS